MDIDKITSYSDFLKQIHSKTIDDLLKITDDRVQGHVVRVMMDSFTDPKHIQMFIDRYSPEETKEIRRTLWMLLK